MRSSVTPQGFKTSLSDAQEDMTSRERERKHIRDITATPIFSTDVHVLPLHVMSQVFHERETRSASNSTLSKCKRTTLVEKDCSRRLRRVCLLSFSHRVFRDTRHVSESCNRKVHLEFPFPGNHPQESLGLFRVSSERSVTYLSRRWATLSSCD